MHLIFLSRMKNKTCTIEDQVVMYSNTEAYVDYV